MKHRKLRIAWSVAWGVVAVLLCVLWVRSYWWADTLAFPVTSTHLLGVGSAQGGMTLIKSEYVPGYFKRSWEFAHDDTDDPAIAKLYRPQNRPGYHGVLGLGFIHSTPFFVVCLPYWFLLCLTMWQVASPWRKNWSPRFRLRSLLIATTVVAVALGIIVWAVR